MLFVDFSSEAKTLTHLSTSAEQVNSNRFLGIIISENLLILLPPWIKKHRKGSTSEGN